MKVSFFMLLLLCICAAILTSLLAYSQYRTSGSRDDDYRKILLRSEDLQNQVSELLKQQVRLTQELRTKEAELQKQLAAASALTNAAVSRTNNTSPYRQVFFAKSYLDGDFVGIARVSPVYHTDDTTGLTTFENIVNLSADARGAVVKTVTNVVERDVVRNTTLNNYPAPYYYGYPVWVRPYRTNHWNPNYQNQTPNGPIRTTHPNTGGVTLPNNGNNAGGQWQNGGIWKPEVKWPAQ